MYLIRIYYRPLSYLELVQMPQEEVKSNARSIYSSPSLPRKYHYHKFELLHWGDYGSYICTQYRLL